jgi:hypothetical protein
VTVRLVPVPVRVDCCGLVAAESATLRVVVRPPATVGVKVTTIVQVELAERVVEQVPPVTAQLVGWPPTKVMVIPVTVLVVVFERVKVWAAGVPTGIDPKD